MVEVTAMLKSRYGIHARPAREIYLSSKLFKDTQVYLIDPDTGDIFNTNNILNILQLIKICGDPIIIRTIGGEESKAAEYIASVISEYDIV